MKRKKKISTFMLSILLTLCFIASDFTSVLAAESNGEQNIAQAENGTVATTNLPNAWAERNDHGIARMNDGDPTTLGMTAMSLEYEKVQFHVALSFAKAYKVNKVILVKMKDGAFPVDFSISAYTKNGWKTVASKTNYDSKVGENVFSFSDIDCSAIRLEVTKNGMDTGGTLYGIYLGEFEVYGKETSVSVPKAPNEESLQANVVSLEEAEKIKDARTNIALYAPVSACSELYGYGAELVTDGNISNYFRSTGGDSIDDELWIELSLLENYMIDQVDFYAGKSSDGLPVDFTISVFYDGTWKEVVNETEYFREVVGEVTKHVFKFEPTLGNRIRIAAKSVKVVDTGYYLRFQEIAAYGTLAEGELCVPYDNAVSKSGKIHTSTTVEDLGYYVTLLYDGDLTTGYSSKQYVDENHEEWIEVDFYRPRNVEEVQLKPAEGGNGFPVDFMIQVNQKGEWITACTVTDYETPVDEAWQKIVLDKKYETNKVRIVVTKLGKDMGQYNIRLNEIGIYSSKSEGKGEGAVETISTVGSNYNLAESTKKDIIMSAKSVDLLGLGLFVGGCVLLIAAILCFAFALIDKKKDRLIK